MEKENSRTKLDQVNMEGAGIQMNMEGVEEQGFFSC